MTDKSTYSSEGDKMYNWATELFPINRSITGEGVRETLIYIKSIVPELQIHSIPSGNTAFDWTVPDEWNISEAYIAYENGEKIVDFKNNNLHLMGYSEPVDLWMNFDELDKHLYSLPDQPTAIPYLTSYYKRRWGFCIAHNQRQLFKDGKYHVVIKGSLQPGVLNYGEILIPGESEDEIFLSTYICHPSMANNEISGVVVTTALTKWILENTNRRYSYRIVFLPETIGSIIYLSRNVDKMKQNIKAGFVLTCVGDNRRYSFMPSRLGDTLADRVAKYALENFIASFDTYSFLQRGSDERQYCSPLIDLPVVSVMRSKYGTFPEYHTSLDNLHFISSEGLEGSFDINKKCLQILENNYTYKATTYCEPQLGKRGLYNITSNQDSDDLINLLAYADGLTDLLKISEIIACDFFTCVEIAAVLEKSGLLKKVSSSITNV